MDSSFGQGSPQVDISQLSDFEKKELSQTLTHEFEKAKMQENIHNLTDLCWKKCITGSIKTGQLDKTETSCTENCVQRFMDANETVIGHLQRLQGKM
ncbi:uncharacterized protein KY384_003638 [Bacidia gigantensis]|uniref:uncharacterized protein n=1 Tax=Bacidia gigantensis TaxID=2732470 RepID=UPI001D040386|nr:uncharacterized protein KY384_003638 [Bacidia gigantensis]KAG8532002.1 hypothetical protein KY384_003638 [Bacidia gigantensis]